MTLLLVLDSLLAYFSQQNLDKVNFEMTEKSILKKGRSDNLLIVRVPITFKNYYLIQVSVLYTFYVFVIFLSFLPSVEKEVRVKKFRVKKSSSQIKLFKIISVGIRSEVIIKIHLGLLKFRIEMILFFLFFSRRDF